MPEMAIFYVNEAYQSYKDNKKVYYCDFYILGQVIPSLNPPEDLKNHKFKLDEATIFRLKYDTVSGESLGLVETLAYLTIHGDSMECFFDYGYSKENSKVLYSHYKMKIPNSFLGTIFNRHRIQYEFSALDMESSKTYFFLPSTPDRIEEIKRYMNSVNLIPIDIYQNEFEVDGGNFDPSKLDFDHPDRKKEVRQA